MQKQKSLRLQNSSQAVKTVGKQFPLTSFQHVVCNSDSETVMLLEHMKQNCIKDIWSHPPQHGDVAIFLSFDFVTLWWTYYVWSNSSGFWKFVTCCHFYQKKFWTMYSLLFILFWCPSASTGLVSFPKPPDSTESICCCRPDLMPPGWSSRDMQFSPPLHPRGPFTLWGRITKMK